MRLVGIGITNHRRHAGPEAQRVAEGRARGDAARPGPRGRGRRLRSRGAEQGAVDVALVEAGEHLEIGRHAIRRLRQRPELVATRILLCIEVGARVRAGSRDGRRRLHPDAGQRRRAGGAAAPAARARQAPGLAAAGPLRRGRARLRDAAGLPARASAGAHALRIPAAALPGRSRRPRVHAAGAAVARLGLPPRRPRPHRRHPRAEPARQAGRAWASGCSRCAAWATSCSAPTPPSDGVAAAPAAPASRSASARSAVTTSSRRASVRDTSRRAPDQRCEHRGWPGGDDDAEAPASSTGAGPPAARCL